MEPAQNLSQFKEKLLIMASHAEGMVTRAVKAHLDRSEPAAKQALEIVVSITFQCIFSGS